ncbi:hypothetical protein K431DRAFT_290952 [Polychaeton citri CBS 116435]|uniref:MARVEL domain-containing protein n=1 Tax=Polychaeton citri CBS 116435 TaxID=1314669 RepID=A0A9P4QF41_9PEZI|nr:hypothetical protein K431DRAFT_290952 [Polychaeton citri CBS 116435]
MSTDHMITLPKWIWIVKIVQAVLAVIVLALSAYGVHYIPYSGYCYSIFTPLTIGQTLYTGIILTYYFVTLHAWNAGYNWIAMLILEIFAVIFWLSTWASLAVVYVAASADSTYSYSYYDYYYKLRKRDSTSWSAYLGVAIGAAVISAIQWVLFIVTLVILSIHIHRHRKAGMPMKAGGPRTGTVTDGGDVPAHGEPAMVMTAGNNSYPLQQQEAKNPQYQQYPAAAAEQVPQYQQQQSPAIPQAYGNTTAAPVSPQQTGSPAPPQMQPSPYAQQPYQPAVSPAPNGHHEMQ